MALTKKAKEMLEALDIKPRSKARKHYTDDEWNMHAESDPETWPGVLPPHPEGGTYYVNFDPLTGTWFGVSESKTTGRMITIEAYCPTSEDAAETQRRMIDHKLVIEKVPKELIENTEQDRSKREGLPTPRRANDGTV